MNQRKFSISSAYGQLILLIFLPVCILASMGSFLVYKETMKVTKSEQKSLAQALLIRYQPSIKKQLPSLISDENSKLSYQPLHNFEDYHKEDVIVQSHRHLTEIMFVMQAELNLHRVAIVDKYGTVQQSAGSVVGQDWFVLDEPLSTEFVSDIKTDVGVAYGMSLGEAMINGENKELWFFVDMDNQPLEIAYYRIGMSLVTIGLLTSLLLLLSLNIYSRRWIAPIYELRMFLQTVNSESLNDELDLKSEGELKALNIDLSKAFIRLNSDFQELKKHAEETENDLNATLDEMESQNISMRHAQKQAESSSQAKSSFLANISHELRTPLNSIDGFINLLARDDELSEEHKLYIATIRKSSSHLLALVNDVLDFSKIEAGKLVLDSFEFDFYAAIYDVVDMLSPLASEKGLRMGVLFYNDVPLKVVGDELRFKQVLTNLVANAIKFTDVGEVLVKVALDDKKDDFLHIAIQDSGRGVDELHQKQLFTSFNQGDPSITRQYGGTGLGLIISKQITHMMGGNIGFFDNSIANIAQSGSTFWFAMPSNVDVYEAPTSADIVLPTIDKKLYNNSYTKSDTLNMLVWLNHKASFQLLQACVRPLNVKITQANSLAGTLDKLKEQKNYWQWVVIDSDANETQDDMTALLRQVRSYYHGKLSVFGYQVALDTRLLSRYKAFALHEPLDKRQLYAMFEDKAKSNRKTLQNTLRWQGYRILAVDDHLPNLLVLEALLAEQGIDVITAANGFEAIEIISKQSGLPNDRSIDLIFMDLQMPRMSGKEASLEIRSIETKGSRIPIVALTAQGIADEKDALIASGIDDYVGKPINQIHLLTVLQRWLRAKKETDFDGYIEENSIRTSEKKVQKTSNKHSITNPYFTNNKAVDNDMNGSHNSNVEGYQDQDNHKYGYIDYYQSDSVEPKAFSVADNRENGKKFDEDNKLIKKIDIKHFPLYIQQLSNLSLIKQISNIKFDYLSDLPHNFYYYPFLPIISHLKTYQAIFNELKVIDWEDGLNRAADKEDLAAKLISMLIDSTRTEKDELSLAWYEKNVNQLYQTNHRLLGASHYAGVPQLRQAAQWLEDEIYNCSEEYLQQNLRNIEFIYALVIQAIINLETIDLSPWSHLAYNKLSEDDMVWKMI